MSRPCENKMEEKICRELKEKTGVDYAPCRSIFYDEEEGRTLYPNFDYFFELAASGDSPYSYFKGDDSYTLTHPYPCTWGSSDEIYDEKHDSNPQSILPTYHEIIAIYHNFEIELCGSILCKDTRKCVNNPPLVTLRFPTKKEDLIKKQKLPPGWRKTWSKEKEKWFYWEEKKKVSQWNHPWLTLIKDMWEHIWKFQDISENFKWTIHSNMDWKDTSLYEILGANYGTIN